VASLLCLEMAGSHARPVVDLCRRDGNWRERFFPRCCAHATFGRPMRSPRRRENLWAIRLVARPRAAFQGRGLRVWFCSPVSPCGRARTDGDGRSPFFFFGELLKRPAGRIGRCSLCGRTAVPLGACYPVGIRELRGASCSGAIASGWREGVVCHFDASRPARVGTRATGCSRGVSHLIQTFSP